MAVRDFAYRCGSVALSVYKFGEIVGALSIAGLESRVHFSRYGENIAQFVVLPKKIGIRLGGLLQQFEHGH